ncbi:hypothetical protein GTA09_20255 [Rhodococcus hoagii]|nr:hypothetical protein [Prescottella equi]
MSTNRTGWYRIHAAADDKPAEVFIYDRIGETYWGDGVGAKNFTRELADIDADAITVRINSPGGSVYDGIAILNALREHKATITVHVDGLAASAASFIAMAGDEIIMSRNAEMMIHDPMMGCAGNADDMRAAAERLEQVGENVASIYAERAGGTRRPGAQRCAPKPGTRRRKPSTPDWPTRWRPPSAPTPTPRTRSTCRSSTTRAARPLRRRHPRPQAPLPRRRRSTTRRRTPCPP